MSKRHIKQEANFYLRHNYVVPSKRVEFELHCKSWKNCCRCSLGANASRHVLLRGDVPADLLFIGEAPGETEDEIGAPFVGRSGKLLTEIIREDLSSFNFSFAITNTVACIPLNEIDGKLRKPSPAEIGMCFPRVVEVLNLVSPKAVIFLGKVAATLNLPLINILEEKGIAHLNVFHPAYLLRKGGRSPLNLDYKRTILILKKFLETLSSINNKSNRLENSH